MAMREKAVIMDKAAVAKTITRLAHEILEKNRDIDGLVFIGICRRGAYLAKRLAEAVKSISGREAPVGTLDITLYRDDLSEIAEQPQVHETVMDFDINGKNIVLADDVLYTGRTVRCALDELIDFGRPRRIQLAVLIDRGHRELPIRADYVGKNVPTSREEVVEVRLAESDGKDEVVIGTRDPD